MLQKKNNQNKKNVVSNASKKVFFIFICIYFFSLPSCLLCGYIHTPSLQHIELDMLSESIQTELGVLTCRPKGCRVYNQLCHIVATDCKLCRQTLTHILTRKLL